MKEAKSPKVGVVKPDKRVTRVAHNLIDIKALRTRPKYWRRPGETKYKDFRVYTGWKYWSKDYPFLYLPEEHEKIREQVLKDLEEKDDKGDFKIKKLAYFCIRNRNNRITLLFQDRKQLNWTKPNIVIFWGDLRYAKNPDGSENREVMVECPNLYFPVSWDFSDNDKLIVEMQLERDQIWALHGNYLDSYGYGQITKSRIGHEHEGHDLGYNWANFPALKEGGSTFEKTEAGCPACRDCFDFCDELGVKKTDQGLRQTAQWQPKWGVLYSAPKSSKGTVRSYGEVHLPKTGIKIPTNLQISRWEGSTIQADWYTNGHPGVLYLVDYEHYDKGEHSPVYDEGNSDHFHELPRIYNEVPHIMDHSSVQFYFQKKLLFTANCRHLAIDRKITDRTQGKPMFVLHYRICTASSVGGILYKFQSGDIFYRWELEVQGTIMNQTILNDILGALTGKFLQGLGKMAGGVLKAVGGKIAGAFGLGGLWDTFTKEDKKGSRKAEGGLKDILTPDRYKNLSSINVKKGVNTDKPADDEHGKRKAGHTGKGKQGWNVEPSIFYSSTIDFNYDFWGFSNRSMHNPFFIRFEHSERLYNNLINNNAAHPIRTLDIDFSRFKQVLVPGYIEGNVWLSGDTDGFYSGLIARGVRYIKSEKDFAPFKYKYRGLTSYTAKSVSDIKTGQGEEKIEIIKHDKEEIIGTFDGNKAIAGYTTYFRTDTADFFTELNVGKFSSHSTGAGRSGGNTKFSDGSNMVCWGCGLDRSQAHILPITVGGIIYTYFDSNDSNEGTLIVPPNCTLIVDSPAGNIRVKTSEEEIKWHYQGEKADRERDEDIAEQEYQDTDSEPTNTSSEVDMELDDDEDKEDIDIEDEDWGDEDKGEKDEEFDSDPDYDDDIDDDNDDDNDLDDDVDDDDDFDDDDDQDSDDDSDDDDDDDSDDDSDNGDDDKGDKDDDKDDDRG